MISKHNFYKVQTPKGWRIYYIKTFLEQNKIPKEYEIVQTELFRHFRDGLILFFNRQINRYLLYRRYKSVFVHIYTYANENLGYREPGEWLYWQLRKADILVGGSIAKAKALQDYDKYLEAPNPVDLENKKKAQELQDEIYKDYYRMLSGKIGVILGLAQNKLHRKTKKNPVIFALRQSNGKLYRRVKKHAK